MSTQKEKQYQAVSLQISPENPEKYTIAEADDYMKVSLEKKRKEASEPLYLKRI
jgi:hypothetical protein